jgi:BirA family biotin operon repressor/biotin-[acetyl-CoA-carboxylase] ligase
MSFRLIELTQVGSTNDWVAERGEDGLWVRADQQTEGRGRRGRAWTSAAGNLFASTFAAPRPGEGPAQQLSFVAANALLETVSHWVPRARLALKWPNDLLLDGVKLAGILLEGHARGVVIGFGVNLAHHPTEVERPATSLAAAGIPSPSPGEALQVLAECFERHHTLWREEGFAAVRSLWLESASGLGGPALARLGGEEVRGVFEDLGPDGALHLRLPGGALRTIHAGEVFMLEGQG